ncbi:hypothetical protein MTBMA_c15950 [Methanothermobacter marburgensis str. Marburg]|uniref:Uncharacterized protein n=1 Tax=Methanothermobacter marburgensis (strain ATCC BAA-927 / DSM 2133 / JCM 14651 / NBRC 100331 / OCM 82 / Marburg) TaxID=79929 RepID=D9PY76_METTM|nr:hypothetical protein MTBMA_c15950 [Methanothermobacter marburgensis str. Marburg]
MELNLGFIGVIIGEGDLILRIRDHYLPREYWKYRIIQGHSMVMRLGLMLVRIIVYTILKYRRTLM